MKRTFITTLLAISTLAVNIARAGVWFNKANFERLRRARELPQAKGVTSNQIALAYVLCQSPQVFALIGPENIEELRQCLEGLHLTLSSSERRWLNLESTGV